MGTKWNTMRSFFVLLCQLGHMLQSLHKRTNKTNNKNCNGKMDMGIASFALI